MHLDEDNAMKIVVGWGITWKKISEFLVIENDHGFIVLYMNGSHLVHLERRLKFRTS